MDTSNFKEVFESPKVKALTAQVAALELEVASLRSVMADVIRAHGYTGGTPIEVMSTQFTPTALNEVLNILHDASAWETVSGEPQNLQEDEANTATVEDGSVAKAAISRVKGEQ